MIKFAAQRSRWCRQLRDTFLIWSTRCPQIGCVFAGAKGDPDSITATFYFRSSWGSTAWFGVLSSLGTTVSFSNLSWLITERGLSCHASLVVWLGQIQLHGGQIKWDVRTDFLVQRLISFGGIIWPELKLSRASGGEVAAKLSYCDWCKWQNL